MLLLDDEFDDPFDIEQVNDASKQFISKFQDSFDDNGITAIVQPLAPYKTHLEPETPNSDIPLFDKSFIVMARQLLNEIYTLESTTHITNGEGAIQMFNEINNLIIQNGFATNKNDADCFEQNLPNSYISCTSSNAADKIIINVI